MDDDLEIRLRKLARKWMSNARHPQNRYHPDRMETLERCAGQLMKELTGEPPPERHLRSVKMPD